MSPKSTRDVKAGCPAPEILAAFQLGTLAADQLETVGNHLQTCPTCESFMQTVATPPDELVSSLRKLAGSESDSYGDPLRDEMATLEQQMFDLMPGHDSTEGPGLRQLGEYQLLEKLGQGGMGTVYRAVHTRLNKVVALKVLRDDRGKERLARFRREMRAGGKLHHPNIVEATDAGEDRGVHFLVLEFVEGTDLARLIKQFGPLPVAEACELVRQATLGLRHAHERGLVHRDIKPSNLLLSTDGQVKVADLGLVGGHVDEAETLATTSDHVLGSLEYMAPEQADNPHGADARADLYALGCTLYHLLSGQPPFAGDSCRTALQKLKAHAATPAPALAGLRPDVPPALARLVHKLLAKRPGDRVASAEALAEALRPFAAGADLRCLALGVEIDTPQPAPRAARRRPRGLLLVVALLGALLLLAAAVVFYIVTDNGVLEIATDDPDVKVSVEQNGKVITLLDGKTKKQTRLATGEYQLKVIAGGEDLEMKPGAVVVLKRGAKEIVTIKRIGGATPLVNVPTKLPALDLAWIKKVNDLPPKSQGDEIIAELKRRNPGFSPAKVVTDVREGKLEVLQIVGALKLVDLTPVQAAPHLRSLAVFDDPDLANLSQLKGLKKLDSLEILGTQVADLRPLKDMKLKYLNLSGALVKDLSPLLGQPLRSIDLSNTPVTDLTPLALSELENLSCAASKVTDLAPLAKLKKLTGLNCSVTEISDLKPLAGLSLTRLECSKTQVKDLSPLKNMPLKVLNFESSPVTDLSPLRGLPVETLICDFDKNRDLDVLRSLKQLKTLNGKAAADQLK